MYLDLCLDICTKYFFAVQLLSLFKKKVLILNQIAKCTLKAFDFHLESWFEGLRCVLAMCVGRVVQCPLEISPSSQGHAVCVNPAIPLYCNRVNM